MVIHVSQQGESTEASPSEFSSSELREANERRNARGQKMTPTRVRQARTLYASGRATILEIAEMIGVSPSTVHRHLN